MKPAIFLDKDGTLVENVPYNVDPKRIVFAPFAGPALRLLAEAGYVFAIVTNQPGLAWGRFSRSEFATLEAALVARIRREFGIALLGVYCCPHAPDAAGRPACLCRKPAPGLLRRAALAHGLDLRRSWLVGDILDDVEAGHRAGCRSAMVDVGNETVWKLTPSRRPDVRVADLLQAAEAIVALGQPSPRPASVLAS